METVESCSHIFTILKFSILITSGYGLSPTTTFNSKSAEVAKLIREVMRETTENCGQAGRRFTKYLVRNRDQWTNWRNRFELYVANYETKAGNNDFARRQSPCFAVVQLAAELLNEALNFNWLNNPVEPLYEELSREAQQADLAAEAMRMVIDWAAASRDDFWRGRTDKVAPRGGWLGVWKRRSGHKAIEGDNDVDDFQSRNCIGILPDVLEKRLRDSGYDPDAILRTWKERGWLIVSSAERRKFRTSLGGEDIYVYAISALAHEQIHLEISPPRGDRNAS